MENGEFRTENDKEGKSAKVKTFSNTHVIYDFRITICFSSKCLLHFKQIVILKS
jgi:hypothetical protein